MSVVWNSEYNKGSDLTLPLLFVFRKDYSGILTGRLSYHKRRGEHCGEDA